MLRHYLAVARRHLHRRIGIRTRYFTLLTI